MQYHNITKDDMLNGDGLRVVLWVAGCGHACPGCHNPVTWDENGGLPFDEAAKQEIFRRSFQGLCRGRDLFGRRPALSANREQIGALAQEIRARFPDKTIWLYTGYRFEQITDLPFLAAIDVVVDGPFIEAQKDTQLHWRGSANQRVIDVARTLETGAVCLHENTEK